MIYECGIRIKFLVGDKKGVERMETRRTRILRIYADFLGCFIFRLHFEYIGIRMDVRISRISPIGTDFFCFFCLGFRAGIPKKIRTNP
ncbi:MAG: hypothetical protein RLZZ628_2964 [Bacteroidota bacterium]|jgi:hypothetical protein